MLILTLILAGGFTRADIVARYQTDYVASSTAGQTRTDRSADGWNYQWNSAGAIGTASNYSNLVWNTTATLDGQTGGYTANSSQYPEVSTANYVGLFANGVGHPGVGSGQPGSGGIDRYAIAAYTIQTGEAGSATLSDGVLSNTGSAVDLSIYVNNTLI